MNTISGTITSTGAACTELAYTGGALIGSVQLVIASITGATAVQISIYDNNVVRSSTAATGATWSGKSPGYTGAVGPGSIRQLPQFYQSARVGDQQGQTAPNAGVEVYWNLDANNNLTLAATPVLRSAVSAAANPQGSGSFPTKNMTANNITVGAVTAARLLYSTTLAAGQAVTWTPPEGLGVSYGLQIVAQAAGATGIAGSYNAAISPTP
jgi:hypothetical protein